jgi:hypothetical protein
VPLRSVTASGLRYCVAGAMVSALRIGSGSALHSRALGGRVAR